MTVWIAAALIAFGGVFVLVAGVGVLRLPDAYSRMHAATKAGTLGLLLICAAAMLLAETWAQVAEAGFVFFFMIASAPVGAHLVGRAAFRTRTAEAARTMRDPDVERFREGDGAGTTRGR